MEIELKLDRNMRIIGADSRGHETVFDSHTFPGDEDSAPSPMEILLQAMAACSFMDVISIIRKKRKIVNDLKIYATAKREDTHPKVISKVHLIFELFSSDAEIYDLNKAIELSQTTYCGASIMFQRSGCEVTWEGKISRD
jgi:putative redox protein